MGLLREHKPECVVMVARGSSLHAALFAKYIFDTLGGLPVSVANPSILTRYNGKLLLGRAFIIAISRSGEGLDVCAVAERGRACGGLVTAVTNTIPSRLSA